MTKLITHKICFKLLINLPLYKLQDILDAYHNLVLKGISWMKWTVTKCPAARWIIKVDDDIAVKVFALAEYLEKQDNTKNESGVDQDEAY